MSEYLHIYPFYIDLIGLYVNLLCLEVIKYSFNISVLLVISICYRKIIDTHSSACFFNVSSFSI